MRGRLLQKWTRVRLRLLPGPWANPVAVRFEGIVNVVGGQENGPQIFVPVDHTPAEIERWVVPAGIVAENTVVTVGHEAVAKIGPGPCPIPREPETKGRVAVHSGVTPFTRSK